MGLQRESWHDHVGAMDHHYEGKRQGDGEHSGKAESSGEHLKETKGKASCEKGLGWREPESPEDHEPAEMAKEIERGCENQVLQEGSAGKEGIEGEVNQFAEFCERPSY